MDPIIRERDASLVIFFSRPVSISTKPLFISATFVPYISSMNKLFSRPKVESVGSCSLTLSKP
jgi:hypothetical protein